MADDIFAPFRCGPAKKTSSTTSIVRSIGTPLPRPCPTARSSAGNIGSAARPSSRAGCRPPFRKGSTSTPSIAGSTCPTTFPISMSNMFAPNRRRCRPGSGVGVGPNNDVFAVECFMDELARKPARIRLTSAGRCLEISRVFLRRSIFAAEKSNWGGPLPARVGRGVCVQPSFGSFIATVVEVEADEQGEMHLRHSRVG
jgi:hypothetical protein